MSLISDLNSSLFSINKTNIKYYSINIKHMQK